MSLRSDWALVLGGGKDVWLDVLRLERMIGPWPGLVVACNDAGVAWPRRLDHWVSLHPEKFHVVSASDGIGEWRRKREAEGFPGGYVTWARRNPEMVDRICESWNGGSSGLYAVAVAYHLGCSRVVLCGVPMTPTVHFHGGRREQPWYDADDFWPVWERHLERLKERTRSMSGRTRDALGAPTPQWLGEQHAQEA